MAVLDMNEPETQNTPAPEQQGIPVTKLLEIIGKQQVEWLVNEEAVGKMKAQVQVIVQQNAALLSENKGLKEVKPVSPELEQLRKSNSAGDVRVSGLEAQVHSVALERDAAQAQAKATMTELTKAREDYTGLQRVCEGLQKKVETLTVNAKPVTVPKGKKR